MQCIFSVFVDLSSEHSIIYLAILFGMATLCTNQVLLTDKAMLLEHLSLLEITKNLDSFVSGGAKKFLYTGPKKGGEEEEDVPWNFNTKSQKQSKYHCLCVNALSGSPHSSADRTRSIN